MHDVSSSVRIICASAHVFHGVVVVYSRYGIHFVQCYSLYTNYQEVLEVSIAVLIYYNACIPAMSK